MAKKEIKVTDEGRQARWEAFLESARAQAEKNGTLEIFEAQKANGEFDTIPASFEQVAGFAPAV